MPIPFSEAVTTPTIIPWAVTATHNFLSQEISATTSLITAGLDTPGTENYVADYLLTDYNIVLPQIGTTSHFVAPNQPIFTFTKSTRVLMLIPVTTSINLLKSQGWVYLKPTTSSAAAFDDQTTILTNSPPDWYFEKMYAAGTYNMDPNQQAPLAFYFFEERTFDEQVPVNTSSIGANTEMLSAISGSRASKALIVHSTGNVGLGTTGTPDAKLHVVGDVKATGFIVGKPQVYQTSNNNKVDVNSVPTGTHILLSDTGLARDAGDYKQYTGWKTQGNVFTNSDTSMFASVGNYGVKCTVEGYYKMTCHMFFHSTEQNASVAVRFAKGDLNNNVNNSGFENPGPVQVSGPITNIPAGRNTSSTTNLSHVILCAANDILSVYTTRAGVTGVVTTAPCTCTLRVEYLGPS